MKNNFANIQCYPAIAEDYILLINITCYHKHGLFMQKTETKESSKPSFLQPLISGI